MNMQDHRHDEERLRLALRGLRRDVAPTRDLWPGIASRIAQAPRERPAPRRVRPWMPSLALAASLLLAVGIAWQQRPQPASSAPLIQREAQAMTRQYRAALLELERSAPHASASPFAPTLQELDRSAAQIRTALDRDPDARFLLDSLRRTYTRRLALTQRAVLT
jgi:hypothetical protein